IVRPGIDGYVAFIAVALGTAAAILAYLRTSDPVKETKIDPASSEPRASTHAERRRLRQRTLPDSSSPLTKYRNVWTWILAAVFAIFAVRSFCWLLYIDGSDLRIQSPNNLGDLALHVTHINYFANGVPLWPANPIYV